MAHQQTKAITISIVFILAVIFFWAALNRLLYESKAQLGSQAQLFMYEREVKCNPDPKGICRTHVYVHTDTSVKVAGIASSMSYSDGLIFDSFVMDAFCNNSSAHLDTDIKIKHDPQARTIRFALGSLKKNDELTSGGPNCIGAILFKPAGAGPFPQDTSAQLSSIPPSEIVSIPASELKINTEPVKIILTPDVPVDIPSSNSCDKKSKGDCDCSGNISGKDFEMLRQENLQEKASTECDFNSDGSANTLDYGIWKANIENVGAIQNISSFAIQQIQ